MRSIRYPRWLQHLLWLTLTGTLIATLLSLLAKQHWFFELFTHFRPYYLLLQLMLIAVLIKQRRAVLLVLTVLLALPNVRYVGPYVAPWLVQESAAVGAGESLTILVINLSYRNHQHEVVLDYVRQTSPDVVLFSELTPEWQQALVELTPGYPYHFGNAVEGPYGMGLYSRVPVNDIASTDLGVPGTVNIRAELEIAGHPLDLYGVHLMAPVKTDWAASRIGQFDALSEFIRTESEPGHMTLVAGDFNSTPFSPYFVELLQSTGLVDAARRHGLRSTWPVTAQPLGIPIDHCLVSHGVAVTQVSLGPDVGSDHLPLEITVGPILAAN